MEELPYKNIPDCPEQLSATNAIARLVDGLGFRYQLATEGLTKNELAFRPERGSMNVLEVLIHLYEMAVYTHRFFGGPKSTDPKPESFEELRKSTLHLYTDLSARLKSMDDAQLLTFKLLNRMGRDEISFWYFINGPIADALTHVGQITSWRRIAGNPQPKGANVFLGTNNK